MHLAARRGSIPSSRTTRRSRRGCRQKLARNFLKLGPKRSFRSRNGLARYARATCLEDGLHSSFYLQVTEPKTTPCHQLRYKCHVGVFVKMHIVLARSKTGPLLKNISAQTCSTVLNDTFKSILLV